VTWANPVLPPPHPLPVTYLVQCLANKYSTLYIILKFTVRMLVFIEISTLNPTFGAITPKKFITANSLQRDPITTPLLTYFFDSFIYFLSDRRSRIGLIWLRIRNFVLVTSNPRGHMSDVNEARRQGNIKTEVEDTV